MWTVVDGGVNGGERRGYFDADCDIDIDIDARRVSALWAFRNFLLTIPRHRIFCVFCAFLWRVIGHEKAQNAQKDHLDRRGRRGDFDADCDIDIDARRVSAPWAFQNFLLVIPLHRKFCVFCVFLWLVIGHEKAQNAQKDHLARGGVAATGGLWIRKIVYVFPGFVHGQWRMPTI